MVWVRSASSERVDTAGPGLWGKPVESYVHEDSICIKYIYIKYKGLRGDLVQSDVHKDSMSMSAENTPYQQVVWQKRKMTCLHT